MPLTRQQKKNLNITDLQSYAMASDDAIDARLEAFEARMKDILRTLLEEFKLGRLESPKRSPRGENSYHKENQSGKGDQAQDFAYSRMRVDFPRWEDEDLTGWISRAEWYFRFHKTLYASMVDIAAIYLEGDAIQWYDWFEYIHGVPTWRQFKSELLICFRPSEYENDIDLKFEEEDAEQEPQLAVSTVHSLASYANPQTMKIDGVLKQQPINVLIDTGSTGNFIDNKVAALTLRIEDCNMFDVKVADGQTLNCSHK
ncbi:hypothetical protein BHE74_00034483 [Ensete ventricosum]|nr:hypothetical protein BHE74_00034483 [Ensete ventricosum]